MCFKWTVEIADNFINEDTWAICELLCLVTFNEALVNIIYNSADSRSIRKGECGQRYWNFENLWNFL